MRSTLGGALIAVVACGGEARELTYEEHIKPLLDEKCGGCHVAGGIAPFALTSAQEVRAHAAEIKQAVESRSMPPWLAAPGYEPLRYDRSLTSEQIALIGAWVDEGAAIGRARHREQARALELGGLSRVDLTLTMPEAYAPEGHADVYRCFVLDWPETSTRYVTGFNAVPGNTGIVHHLVTFMVGPQFAALPEQFDAKDPGPGYTCFGGPSAEGAPEFPTSFFGQWAPGMLGLDFPDASGIPVAPGSKLVLQVHYHPGHGSGKDQTSLQYRLDETVQKRGYYVPWFDLGWYLDPSSMRISAGAADVVHSYASTSANHVLLGQFAQGADFTHGMLLHSVLLHMHRQGASTSLFIQDGAGARDTLVHIPRWDFDWQNEYTLETPRLITPDQALGIECHWSNPTGHDLRWGESTNEEMCASFVYVTEP